MRELSTMDKKIIEQKANEFLKTYELEDTVFTPIIKIAELNGFAVRNVRMEDAYDGLIIVDPNAKSVMNLQTNKFIGVNSTRDHAFKRFIVAHEIGHYILQEGTAIAHRENAHPKSDNEQDMDFFAACLLMPQIKVKKCYEALRVLNPKMTILDITANLASKFIVPYESMRRRLNELGIIHDGQ